MNIAIFASAFHPHFGGVEELCRQLALELRRRGNHAIILTNRWPRDLPRHEVIDGVPVYRPAFRTPDAGAKSVLSYHLSRRAVAREVAGILRRHSIDVLHVQCVSSNAYYALEAHRALGVPLVVTLQGELTMDASQLFQRSPFARQTLGRCLADADVVTACSRKTLEDGEAFAGQRAARGCVIFNGASIDDFARAAPHRHCAPYILGIGRLVPQKGFDILLRAYAKVDPLPVELLIAGDGPEREPLEALARHLGIADRVTFFGRADRAAVPSLFSGAEFVALPSRADEGLPVVCAETMAAGKAIVATRTGGAPEAVIDGETGIIVEKEDVNGLSRALRALIEDRALRDRFATAGRERAKEFEWGRIAEQYVGIYQALRPAAAAGAVRGEGLADGHRGAAVAGAVPGSVA